MPGTPRNPGARDGATSDDIREPINEARLHEIEDAVEIGRAHV